MHEFSICQSIVDTLIAEYEKISPAPGPLVSARIKVGRLHQIVTESLVSAFEFLTKGTKAEGSRLDIDFVDVMCKCRVCGWEGEIDFPFFICKGCGAGDVEVVHGKELYLENMEIADGK